MGNLSSHHYYSSSSAAASPNPSSPLRDSTPVAEGYVSDDPAHASCSSNCRIERKKGNPWTEEEHRLFLMGLQKLGKGDWRGIARNFVMSRTPTQVASHAQKYFIRQTNATRRKRRSSLFDMVPDMASDPPPVAEEQFLLPSSKPEDTKNLSQLAPVSLSLDQEYEPMEVTVKETCTEPAENVSSSDFPPVIPAFFPTYLPVPFPFWPPDLVAAGEEKEVETSQHEVIKPIPVLPKDPVNVDDLGGMSQLSLREDVGGPMKPSPLSLKLIGAPSRPSAFHANTPVNESDLGNAIHAV